MPGEPTRWLVEISLFGTEPASGRGELLAKSRLSAGGPENRTRVETSDPRFALALCGAPSHGAMIQAFINWAEKNPQQWATGKTAGVMLALQESWPCR